MELRKAEINQGKICPYCGSKTEYIDSIQVYRKSYGMMFMCFPCDAYVGTHNETGEALGRLANAELREWKKRAHAYFDPIAKTKLINEIYPIYISGVSNRQKAYQWLSGKMDLKKEYCHVGMFDIDQCKQVIEICKPYLLIQT